MRILLLLFALPVFAVPPPPARFLEHTIATGLRDGYQVVVADMNHDGKPDLIALASGMAELVWYENPTWQRHIIAGNLHHMINLAAYDIDGDGIPEILLAHGFSNKAGERPGIVSVLKHNGDPRQPWTVTEIDRLTTSHRIRLADFDRSGHKVFLNAPLTGATSVAPDYREHVPLVFYRPEDWKRRTIDAENQGVQHGIYVVDWDRNGRDSILTASFSGIHLLKFDGKRWSRTEITRGNPAPWPKSGTSDIAVGNSAKSRYIAAIEPWHGTQVVVYRQRRKNWQREVLDSSLVDGHTIITADLNGDGQDEVIAGYRGQGQSVIIYSPLGRRWTKLVLDNGGMAAASCVAADLNGDRRMDIICIGSATANLKWYENLGS